MQLGGEGAERVGGQFERSLKQLLEGSDKRSCQESSKS